MNKSLTAIPAAAMLAAVTSESVGRSTLLEQLLHIGSKYARGVADDDMPQYAMPINDKFCRESGNAKLLG